MRKFTESNSSTYGLGSDFSLSAYRRRFLSPPGSHTQSHKTTSILATLLSSFHYKHLIIKHNSPKVKGQKHYFSRRKLSVRDEIFDESIRDYPSYLEHIIHRRELFRQATGTNRVSPGVAFTPVKACKVMRIRGMS